MLVIYCIVLLLLYKFVNWSVYYTLNLNQLPVGQASLLVMITYNFKAFNLNGKCIMDIFAKSTCPLFLGIEIGLKNNIEIKQVTYIVDDIFCGMIIKKGVTK